MKKKTCTHKQKENVKVFLKKVFFLFHSCEKKAVYTGPVKNKLPSKLKCKNIVKALLYLKGLSQTHTGLTPNDGGVCILRVLYSPAHKWVRWKKNPVMLLEAALCWPCLPLHRLSPHLWRNTKAITKRMSQAKNSQLWAITYRNILVITNYSRQPFQHIGGSVYLIMDKRYRLMLILQQM